MMVGIRFERVAPDSAEARTCVRRYFDELDRRFDHGFDPDASLAAEDDALIPPRGAFLVASSNGEPVACGAVKAIAPGIASLKRMWVADSARGHGIGRQMLAALEEQARELGLTIVRLETNRALGEAIALYRSAGYRETEAFNADPYADHWFEKTLD
jgi:GNAT superfamily N-acetyltransferase